MTLPSSNLNLLVFLIEQTQIREKQDISRCPLLESMHGA
jgi:hypothetical protein